MKRIFFFVFIGFITLNTVKAQSPNFNPEEVISMQMEKIQPALDLDNLEAILMKNILIKYTKERMALRGQNLEREVLMERNKEISEKQDAELSELLSEEQLEKFKKLQEEFRNTYFDYISLETYIGTF